MVRPKAEEKNEKHIPTPQPTLSVSLGVFENITHKRQNVPLRILLTCRYYIGFSKFHRIFITCTPRQTQLERSSQGG
jgi:hypothetical protein